MEHDIVSTPAFRTNLLLPRFTRYLPQATLTALPHPAFKTFTTKSIPTSPSPFVLHCRCRFWALSPCQLGAYASILIIHTP